jgi:hypothetical protein
MNDFNRGQLQVQENMKQTLKDVSELKDNYLREINAQSSVTTLETDQYKARVQLLSYLNKLPRKSFTNKEFKIISQIKKKLLVMQKEYITNSGK